MYFMIKKEKFSVSIWNFGKKLAISLKKLIVNLLIYSRKYLIAKKHSAQKKTFNVFIEK